MPNKSVFRNGLSHERVVIVAGGRSGIGRRTPHELASLRELRAVRNARFLDEMCLTRPGEGIRSTRRDQNRRACRDWHCFGSFIRVVCGNVDIGVNRHRD